MLYSKGKSYEKHSAVLAAFRQYFIKAGEFEKNWSDDYKVIMQNRHTADYELQDDIEKEDAVETTEKFKAFIQGVKTWLQKTIFFRVIPKKKRFENLLRESAPLMATKFNAPLCLVLKQEIQKCILLTFKLN